MNPPTTKVLIFEAGSVLFLTVAIFVLDVITPLGWADWMLYFIPLVITLQSSRERIPYHFAAVATLLTAVGGYLSPGDIDAGMALFNRCLGIVVMWAFTWLMVRQKRASALLVGAETARSQAETHREAAVAARDLAEASALGALHRESQAARELLISSLRLESILQSAMDAIITIDDGQHVLLFNESAERMFQCPAREVIGQTLDKFLPARFRDAHRHHIEGFGRSGVTSRKMGELGTVTGLRGNGEEFPVEAAISHITVEGKRFYTVILRDITERKQTEEALRQSEARLRATLDTMMEGCQIIGFDWKYLYVNEAACRHGRRPRAQLLGHTLMEAYPGLEQTPFFRELDRCMRQRAACGMENEFVFQDGSKALFDICIEPVPEGLLVLSYDVTDRKQAEKLIRQSEERYRRLIQVSPDAIIVSRGERVIFANDQALKLFRAVKADEILGKSPFELFHPDCHPMIQQRIQELLAGNPIVPIVEEKILSVDGTGIAVDVEVSAAQFTDEEGAAILVMLRDVSERKRLQEQLRRTERVAELGTLASGMAHEIGTPMNVILGRAEYLMDRVKDEPIKKGLKTIVAQVERITRVMNQLLSFARRRPPERRALDLRDVLENSAEMFQERLAGHRIRVELALDAACPPVHADADQMSQVFINLIMNAIHAMPDGGTLRIQMAPDEGMVKVTVSDTGHGIPEEVLSHIFEPFFTTKDFGKGTGLGLTVVKGILDEHGGRITVASEIGVGTTFTILFPPAAR